MHGTLGAIACALGAYADLLLAALREYAAMLFRDLIFAFRSLRKTPAFALVVIAALALAIGANATVFSILRAVVLAPLPYPQSDRLVAIRGLLDAKTFSLSLPDFEDLRAQNRTLSSAAAYVQDTKTLTGSDEPRKLDGTMTTSDLFAVLAARPQLGRFFRAGDALKGAARTVVISAALWHSALHADPDAVGRLLTLDGDAYHVIGVTPAGFEQPGRSGYTRSDYWVPLISGRS